MFTKRAAQGIAECEHALALDRNLASAHAIIGLGKIFIGRAEETEAHVAEALRLSPRDTLAYAWISAAGIAKSHIGSWEEAVALFRRAVEANRNFPVAHFCWPPPSRSLVDSTRRVPQSRPVSRSTRPSPSPAPAPPGQRGATTRRISPSLSPFSTACARPVSPNNDRRPPRRRDPRRRRPSAPPTVNCEAALREVQGQAIFADQSNTKERLWVSAAEPKSMARAPTSRLRASTLSASPALSWSTRSGESSSSLTAASVIWLCDDAVVRVRLFLLARPRCFDWLHEVISATSSGRIQ